MKAFHFLTKRKLRHRYSTGEEANLSNTQHTDDVGVDSYAGWMCQVNNNTLGSLSPLAMEIHSLILSFCDWRTVSIFSLTNKATRLMTRNNFFEFEPDWIQTRREHCVFNVVRVYAGHTATVYCCNFHNNGDLFASASRDKTVRVWHVGKAQPQRILEGHNGHALSCHFAPTPEPSKLVSASEDKTAKIWDIETGQKVHTLKGHSATVYCATYSNDARMVATASRDRKIKLWDARSGKRISNLKGCSGFFCCQFSPDDKKVVSCTSTSLITMWDLSTGKALFSKQAHDKQIWSCSFSPTGDYFLSCSEDRSIKLWGSNSGEELQKLLGHDGAVYQATWLKDGAKIVSTSADRTLKVWDVSTGRVCSTFKGHHSPVYYCTVKNGLILSCSSNYIKPLRLNAKQKAS
eukprot:TRINITY_DN59980_c0_g1_i1.p1 TRINITY_DN59980_c0_g1~~TRINITY_DN59980_c0_g1_i1.p1  ORF type:complete len:405 (+),score=45.15 TRINITY_DN59980_c0_g1_i1:104-1318(+)